MGRSPCGPIMPSSRHLPQHGSSSVPRLRLLRRRRLKLANKATDTPHERAILHLGVNSPEEKSLQALHPAGSVHESTNLNHRILGKLPWCKSVHPATRSPLVRHNPAPSCDCLNRANPNSSCKPQQLRHFGVETLRSWETSRQTNKSPQFQ